MPSVTVSGKQAIKFIGEKETTESRRQHPRPVLTTGHYHTAASSIFVVDIILKY